MPPTKKQPPSVKQVKDTRAFAGLSVPSSGALIYVSRRMWHKYESGEAKMHPAFFELYRVKTGQF